MSIQKVTDNKKAYIGLLLLVGEQEDMIDKYLERDEVSILHNDGVRAEYVITKESGDIYKLKNTAVMPNYQRKGYGKRMIDFLLPHYTDCKTLLVGTRDAPSVPRFYHKCGFIGSHHIKNFFADNCDHPMFEDGKQLVGMIYLRRKR